MKALWGTPVVYAVLVPLAVGGCSRSGAEADIVGAISPQAAPAHTYAYSARDRECLSRAMFFESNRSSREGLVAVGTVVMNRVESGRFGNSVCDVVAAKGQFAPGVMTRPMDSKALPDVMAAADAVLKGERHPKVKKEAMYFHTAGLKFPYRNMHYVLVAGGNAFYEKRSRRKISDQPEPALAGTMVASAAPSPRPAAAAAPSVSAGAPAQVAAVASPRKTVPEGPAAERFGVAQNRPSGPASLAAADVPVQQDTFAYEASLDQASAIGALLLRQDRPPE